MSKDLETLTAALLQAATRAGADAADAMALDGTALGIDTRGGRLEQAERAEGLEFGLRVLIGQRSAVVSGSDARPEVLAAMAERAVAMAREAPEDPYIGLADPALLARDVDAAALELFDPAAEPSPAELEQDAREAEAVRAVIAAVPEPFREALVLREMESLSYREIATLTGVPIGTVMSRLARAREMLTRLLLPSAGDTPPLRREDSL